MKKFECHITIFPDRPTYDIQHIVEARSWKFSCIDGDPDFGNSKFCYATRWFENKDFAIQLTHEHKHEFLKKGLSVIRVKVEEIVHDSRLVNGEWKEIQ